MLANAVDWQAITEWITVAGVIGCVIS